MIVHIGKKVPKGFTELSGSIHMGKGVWAFRCELDKTHALVQPQKDLLDLHRAYCKVKRCAVCGKRGKKKAGRK